MTLSPPDLHGISFARSLDAAVGAATALVVSLLVLPIDVVRLIREAAEPVLAELAATLEDIATALEERSEAGTEAALLRARAIDDDLGRFREAIDVGQEGGMTTIGRRTARRQIGFYATAGAQIDLAVRNTRVLARGAMRAIATGDATPPGVSLALRELAESVRALATILDDPAREADVLVEPAVRAAAHATIVLEGTANLSVSVIVGQTASTATDLLRSTGMGFVDGAPHRAGRRRAGDRRPGRTLEAQCANRGCGSPRRTTVNVIRTSVPPSGCVEICTASASRVMSGSPSPRPGLSGRGVMPRPWSRMTTWTMSSMSRAESSTGPGRPSSRYAWSTAFVAASETARPMSSTSAIGTGSVSSSALSAWRSSPTLAGTAGTRSSNA